MAPIDSQSSAVNSMSGAPSVRCAHVADSISSALNLESRPSSAVRMSQTPLLAAPSAPLVSAPPRDRYSIRLPVTVCQSLLPRSARLRTSQTPLLGFAALRLGCPALEKLRR